MSLTQLEKKEILDALKADAVEITALKKAPSLDSVSGFPAVSNGAMVLVPASLLTSLISAAQNAATEARAAASNSASFAESAKNTAESASLSAAAAKKSATTASDNSTILLEFLTPAMDESQGDGSQFAAELNRYTEAYNDMSKLKRYLGGSIPASTTLPDTLSSLSTNLATEALTAAEIESAWAAAESAAATASLSEETPTPAVT